MSAFVTGGPLSSRGRGYEVIPDISFSATSLIGFVNTSTSNSIQPPGVSCPTGNCTWPIFSTLGLCNTCLDISEHIFEEKRQGMPDESVFSSCYGVDYTVVENYTSYVVPYNAGRRLLIQGADGGTGELCGKPTSNVALSAVFHPNETYKFKHSETLLASFAMIEIAPGYWNGTTAFEKSRPKATECAFEFCALVLQADMLSGQVTESVLQQSTERAMDSFRPDYSRIHLDQIKVNITQDNQKLLGDSLATSGIQAFEDSSNFMIILERYDLQIQLPSVPSYPNDIQRVFNITQKSIATMMKFFTLNATLESLTYALSDSTNITVTLDTAARLLSNRMREVDNSVVIGTSEQWTTYTVVRWPLFVFPAIVLVGACTFTLVAIFQSSRLGLDIMKPDLLAALIFGLDAQGRGILREEKRKGMKYSDKMLVKLEAETDGLVLRSLI